MHLFHNVLSWAIQNAKKPKIFQGFAPGPHWGRLTASPKTTQLQNSFSSHNARQKPGNHKNCWIRHWLYQTIFECTNLRQNSCVYKIRIQNVFVTRRNTKLKQLRYTIYNSLFCSWTDIQPINELNLHRMRKLFFASIGACHLINLYNGLLDTWYFSTNLKFAKNVTI